MYVMDLEVEPKLSTGECFLDPVFKYVAGTRGPNELRFRERGSRIGGRTQNLTTVSTVCYLLDLPVSSFRSNFLKMVFHWPLPRSPGQTLPKVLFSAYSYI